MKIIRDKQTFTREFKQLTSLIELGVSLPQQVFAGAFVDYRFFVYEQILCDNFADFMIVFLKALGEPSATWITLDPDPTEYFFRRFTHFGCGTMLATDSKQQYFDFLKYSADGNPAEALIHRPITAVLFPPDSKWCIYADARSEIAIIAFKDKATRELAMINSSGISLASVSEALEDPIGYGFSDRALSQDAKHKFMENFGT